MGFDISGLNPVNEKGEYFRNNCWWWRRLATYILNNVELPKTHTQYWGTNDGQKVSAKSAGLIATMLKQHAKEGKLKEFEKQFIEICSTCKGKWKTCPKCNSSGTQVKDGETYPFSEENALSFAEFAENSGGFEIW